MSTQSALKGENLNYAKFSTRVFPTEVHPRIKSIIEEKEKDRFERGSIVLDEPHIMRSMKRSNLEVENDKESFLDLNRAKAVGIASPHLGSSSRNQKLSLEDYQIPVDVLQNRVTASHGDHVRALVLPALASQQLHGNMSEPEGIVLAVANILGRICDELERNGKSHRSITRKIDIYLKSSIGIIEKSIAMPFATFVQELPGLTQTQKKPLQNWRKI